MHFEVARDCAAADGTHAHPWVVLVGRECEDSDEEEQEQLQRGSDAVVQEVGDPPEDAPRYDDGVHDRAQAGLREHYVC